MLDKIKILLKTIWTDICDTWKRVKIYLLALLAIIGVIEWEKIKVTLIMLSAQKETNSSKKEDQVLSQKESSENNQANALVNKAKNEPDPGTDWNLK